MALLTGLMAAGSVLALAKPPAPAPQGYQDRDDDRYRRYDRDDYRYGGFSRARRFGYDDGFEDGARDRRTGHSFRPAYSRNFRHADRGFDWRFANRYEYREAYRASYEEGYRRGYDSGGWRR
jgi:hypothetical protein